MHTYTYTAWKVAIEYSHNVLNVTVITPQSHQSNIVKSDYCHIVNFVLTGYMTTVVIL